MGKTLRKPAVKDKPRHSDKKKPSKPVRKDKSSKYKDRFE